MVVQHLVLPPELAELAHGKIESRKSLYHFLCESNQLS